MPGSVSDNRVTQKWRPPLALVIGGTLTAVLCLPLLGIGYFRIAGNILGWGETSWLIGWMTLFATSILGYLLWRLVLRPVYALTAHANAVKNGRSDAPLPPHFGTPEFSTLAQAVDDMAKALQNREAGIRAYSDHVTHELKSPLTSIIAAAELLEGDISDVDRAELLESIRTSGVRMQHLLNNLRKLAAARTPYNKGPARLSSVLSSLPDTLEVNLNEDGDLPIDENALLVVLEQLSRNAIEHGATRLSLTVRGKSLHIQDNGPGIPEGNKTRVFDPFFTTRRNSGGTGMGLPIVKATLEANDADIALLETVSGTAFLISF